MENTSDSSQKLEVFAVKRWVGAFLLLGLFLAAGSLLLVGSEWESAAEGSSVKVGLVFDNPAGAGDLSFNWMAYQGLMQAVNDLGVVGTVYTPTNQSDYGPMLQQCIEEGNQLCIGVGFLMTDAVWEKAVSFPGTDFAIVDVTWDSYPGNLRGMEFAHEQVGYLAGTLAGLMTASDVIGGVGGIPIPAVRAFLEPYRYGAGCANPDVRVMITYTDSFADPDLGALLAQAQMGQGADVIFGVGGLTGNGAILTATQSGAWGIGVDVDEYDTTFGGGLVPGAENLLTSAMKRVDNAVYDTISDEAAGAFTSGTVTYDLSADGVGLAPYHETDAHIPQAVKDAVEAVRQGILNGSVDPWESCALASHVGLVFDNPAGAGDLSFNWMAYQGLMQAVNDLGVIGTTYTPTGPDDYGPLLQQCVDDRNGLCLSVGFMMHDATWTAADANPGINFAAVDTSWDSYPGNLRGMTFAAEQAGYLAGTLAGLMTGSNVVGAVGGIQVPPVEAFLEPYGYGAGCANPEATVLLTYTSTFTDSALGALVAQSQMDQGADVIFGAGGQTGDGAILTATQSGAWGIGVDIDQWLTLFGSGTVPGSDRLLTSAMKRIDNAVYDTIADAVGDAFTSGTVVYDLAVDGVGLAPFHEAEPDVPQGVRDALQDVRLGILDGSIDVWASCQSQRIYLPLVVRNPGF